MNNLQINEETEAPQGKKRVINITLSYVFFVLFVYTFIEALVLSGDEKSLFRMVGDPFDLIETRLYFFALAGFFLLLAIIHRATGTVALFQSRAPILIFTYTSIALLVPHAVAIPSFLIPGLNSWIFYGGVYLVVLTFHALFLLSAIVTAWMTIGIYKAKSNGYIASSTLNSLFSDSLNIVHPITSVGKKLKSWWGLEYSPTGSDNNPEQTSEQLTEFVPLAIRQRHSEQPDDQNSRKAEPKPNMERVFFIFVAIVYLAITVSVVIIFQRLLEPPQHEPVCPKETKLCPDGSYIGKVPPACNFASCPDGPENWLRFNVPEQSMNFMYPKTLNEKEASIEQTDKQTNQYTIYESEITYGDPVSAKGGDMILPSCKHSLQFSVLNLDEYTYTDTQTKDSSSPSLIVGADIGGQGGYTYNPSDNM